MQIVTFVSVSSILVIGFLLLIRKMLVIVTVMGISMVPTLLPGERLLVMRRLPIIRLNKGQIVIGDFNDLPFIKKPKIRLTRLDGIMKASDKNLLLHPDLPESLFKLNMTGFSKDKTPYFVKRIVGLPGNVVQIHISSLHKAMQSELRDKCDANGYLVWHIPQDCCFVRGDALASGDSVTWGPIPLHAISGLVLTKLPGRDA